MICGQLSTAAPDERIASESPGLGAGPEDTIGAIATPAGLGGIGIVRVSGIQAIAIARKLFKAADQARTLSQGEPVPFKAHHLHYGHIIHPKEGRCLDEVMLAVMPAPHSYTREDVIEIHCHGGGAILQTILRLVLQCGARLAEPGEFTRRAFLNGRIDLTQAEGIADIINARSESALKLAVRQLRGGLKNKIAELVAAITDILVDIEADMEFGNDVDIDGGHTIRRDLMKKVIAPMRSILQGYQQGHLMRDGLRMAIVGRPNVGKSSLLNRLIAHDKAIVTPFPGTTRDPVEATACFEGLAVEIVDTAGLRDSIDPVECIGIQKAREAMEGSDLILFVIEAHELPGPEDDRILELIKARNILIAVNKIDLVGEAKSVPLPEAYRSRGTVFISAKNGDGIENLKRTIAAQWKNEGGEDANEALICELRHKLALESALEAAECCAKGLEEAKAMDMSAMDLQQAIQQLRLITGESAGREVLDQIFNRFCIGK